MLHSIKIFSLIYCLIWPCFFSHSLLFIINPTSYI